MNVARNFFSVGLLAWSAMSLEGQSPGQLGSASTRWTVVPLLMSEYALPEVRGGRRVGDRVTQTAFSSEAVGEFTFSNAHGIFVATQDSIVPLVTELDSIPGTSSRFGDMGDYGLVPSLWSHTRRLQLMAPLQRFEQVGPRRVVFAYVHKGTLGFYHASPQGIALLFALPESLSVDFTRPPSLPPDTSRYARWFNRITATRSRWVRLVTWLADRGSRPTLYLLYRAGLGEIVDTSAPGAVYSTRTSVLVFDSAHATKWITVGDSIGADPGGVLAGLCETIYNNPLPPHDMSRTVCQPRWSSSNTIILAAMVRDGERAQARHRKSLLQLQTSDGGARPLVWADQEILNVPGGRICALPGLGFEWRATPGQAGVQLPLPYSIDGDTCHSGFFIASPAGLERVWTSREGDTLGAVGGRLRSFALGDDRVLEATWTMNSDSKEVVSLVYVSDSPAGVEEGIYSFRDGSATKVVAQNDSAPPEVGGIFRRFRQVVHLGENLLFHADVESGRARGGLFLASSGAVSTVLAEGDSLVDTRVSGLEGLRVRDIGEVHAVSHDSFIVEATVHLRVREARFRVKESTAQAFLLVRQEGLSESH